MIQCTYRLRPFTQLACALLTLLVDASRFLLRCLRPSSTLAAENLFLRKQLALYWERHVKPTCATQATGRPDLARSLVRLAPGAGHCAASDLDPFASPGILAVLAVDIPTRSSPLPAKLRALIGRMARDNPSWGEERITNELLLKLGLRVSPWTVCTYMPKRLDRSPHHRMSSTHGSGARHPTAAAGFAGSSARASAPAADTSARVVHPILGGLHHDYRLEGGNSVTVFLRTTGQVPLPKAVSLWTKVSRSLSGKWEWAGAEAMQPGDGVERHLPTQ
jgi:hypothetical protein